MRRAACLLGVACALLVPVPSALAFEARALLLAERFTPTAAPAENPLARALVALRGESETIQVAFRPDADVRVRPLIEAGRGAPAFVAKAEVVRVGFVAITTPSSGMGGRRGDFADPLPPLPPSGEMEAPGGAWSGVAITFRVPRDARAGVASAALVLRDADSGAELGRVPIGMRVSKVAALAPDDPAAFRVLFGFDEGVYRRYSGVETTGPNVETLFTNLMRFLERRGVSLADPPLSLPANDGTYPDDPPEVSWTGSTRFHVERWNSELRLGARMFPMRGRTMPLVTPQSRPAPTAEAFLRTVASFWNEHGWSGAGNAYAWVDDEPSTRIVRDVVPALNSLLHAHAPGVRALVTTTPKVRTKDRRLCRWWGARTCLTFRGEREDNSHLWDGGADDADVIALPVQRFYGRWTSKIEAHYKIKNERRTWRIVQRVRKAGVDVWTYAYHRPFLKIPQLAIDAPPTDRRLLGLWSAFERNTGFLHWGLARWTEPSGTVQRDPYARPLSFRTAKSVVNGEASLLYPPASARYGLDDPLAEPVSSLRLEELAQGAEDVNLITQLRAAGGAVGATRLLRTIFGEPKRLAPGVGDAWATYPGPDGLATRLEQVRRQAIAQLEARA